MCVYIYVYIYIYELELLWSSLNSKTDCGNDEEAYVKGEEDD